MLGIPVRGSGARSLESASLPERSAVRPITLSQPFRGIGVVEGRRHMIVGTGDIAIAATLMLGDCARDCRFGWVELASRSRFADIASIARLQSFDQRALFAKSLRDEVEDDPDSGNAPKIEVREQP
jgi:hypothetical protein